jgi:hypothetical protein
MGSYRLLPCVVIRTLTQRIPGPLLRMQAAYCVMPTPPLLRAPRASGMTSGFRNGASPLPMSGRVVHHRGNLQGRARVIGDRIARYGLT